MLVSSQCILSHIIFVKVIFWFEVLNLFIMLWFIFKAVSIIQTRFWHVILPRYKFNLQVYLLCLNFTTENCVCSVWQAGRGNDWETECTWLVNSQRDHRTMEAWRSNNHLCFDSRYVDCYWHLSAEYIRMQSKPISVIIKWKLNLLCRAHKRYASCVYAH